MNAAHRSYGRHLRRFRPFHRSSGTFQRMPASHRSSSGPTVAFTTFHRTKYGPEILVDAAWVSDMRGFPRVDPHTLDYYEILLVTGGSGSFMLDGHRYAVKPRNVFFSSPGQV